MPMFSSQPRPVQVITLSLALLALWIGCSIYFQCRPAYLPINQLAGKLSWKEPLLWVPCNCQWHFLVYNLPDGLWVFAFGMVLGAVWQNGANKPIVYNTVLSIPFVMAITQEVMQTFGWVGGTFDWMDLAAYCFFSILYMAFGNAVRVANALWNT